MRTVQIVGKSRPIQFHHHIKSKLKRSVPPGGVYGCILKRPTWVSAYEMPRKKVDGRIRLLIENGVALSRRSMFVVVGDRGRDQVGGPYGAV